jgi:hypothetical protein
MVLYLIVKLNLHHCENLKSKTVLVVTIIAMMIQTEGKGKGKVVPLLFLTEYHAMEAYWGSEGIAPIIL